MRRVAAVFLLTLVSASAFRLPATLQNRLAQTFGKQANDALDTLRLIKSQISNIQLQQQIQANEPPAGLDASLKQLEAAFQALLDKVAPLLDLAPGQVAQAEADIDTLIKDLERLGRGETDVDGGLESIVLDVFNILKSFGASVEPQDVIETTTPMSALDRLLEDLEEMMIIFLPVIAPKLGLSVRDVLKLEINFHSFVVHLEAMGHGTLSLIDGALYVTIDLLNMAEVTDTDITFPTSSTPTEFDVMLDKVDKFFGAVIMFLGGQTGTPEDKLQKMRDDFHQLFVDIEAIEHGEISVYNGLEAFIQDLIYYFQNVE